MREVISSSVKHADTDLLMNAMRAGIKESFYPDQRQEIKEALDKIQEEKTGSFGGQDQRKSGK